MRITIDPKAALRYFIRCYEGKRHNDPNVYHDRFRLRRLERMAGKTFEVAEECPDLYITEPIDGISDVGEDVDKRDVCQVA
jgi:hypothetical protein